MTRGRLIANLFASIPMGWIFAFIALADLKGECVAGEPCFSGRASEASNYGMLVSALICIVIVALEIWRRKKV